MVQADTERVEAIGGTGPLVVDGPQTDEHALVHEDHAILERVDERLVVLVSGGGGPSTATVKPSTSV